jgi:hypothetical protein
MSTLSIEKAKTMDCPVQTMFTYGDPHDPNNTERHTVQRLCCADKCIMWRFFDRIGVGYCGLGGKP